MAEYFRGDPKSIATEGLLSNDPITIATKGLLVAQLSDIIIGGAAGQAQGWTVVASGGLTLGGAADINNTWIVEAIGGITIGGTADLDVIYLPTVGGDLVSSGTANINTTRVHIATSGVEPGGTADVIYAQAQIASGGISIGGEAEVIFDPFKRKRIGRPKVEVDEDRERYHHYDRVTDSGQGDVGEGAVFRPKVLEPKDYWERIQKAIELAEELEKPRVFEYDSNGSIGTLQPAGISSAVYRDQTPEPVRVPDLPLELEHKITINNLFINDITEDDLIEAEDEMILNNQIEGGYYNLDIGNKQRFTYITSNKDDLLIQSQAKVEHVNYILELVHKEDDEFILGKSDNTDDDELRLLGVL